MADDKLKTKIFDNKNLSDIFKEIHKNSQEKKEQINNIIQLVNPMIQTLSDAAHVLPTLKSYIEVGVYNDEQLIKLTSIVQKLLCSTDAKGDNVDGLGLTDVERADLIKSAQDEMKQIAETNKKIEETIEKNNIEEK